MAERKNKPIATVVNADIEQRKREAEEAERLAMQEEMKIQMSAQPKQAMAEPKARGGVGRPTKMRVSVASKRPLQVSTHYTYDVKEKIEDVVRRMKREGVKTASNEEIIFIAVSEWLEQNADSYPVEKFLMYRKEVEA